MKDFSELKNKLLSSIGKAADAGKDLAGKAADKAKAGARIASLTVEIAKEKDALNKAYIEIGKLYYDTHKDDPEGFFIQLCDEVSLSLQNIAGKEAEIAEIKAAGADEPSDVEVEFEEVVSNDEDAACCASGETDAPEAAEDTAGEVEEAPVCETEEAPACEAEETPACETAEEAPAEDAAGEAPAGEEKTGE